MKAVRCINTAGTTSRRHEAVRVDIAVELIELVFSIQRRGMLLKILKDLCA